MDVFTKHQKRIAEKTLAMSISGAAIMGGMNHAQAYQIIFNMSLHDRLVQLLGMYPDATAENWVSTELDKYGWSTAEDWRTLIKSL